ncbi:translocation/assembly module TamB domain-containing protein [Litoribacter ruber]|nr:translocation/assembly module TamB domain-containing protein [Litoribacter ruber]
MVLLRVALFLVLTLALVAALLQIPSVQTRLTKVLTNYITENTGFRTSISKVNIRWWDAVSLSDVVVYDHNDSLMANLEEVYIDFSLQGLLNSDNPSIDEVQLNHGQVRLLTHPEEDDINITVFVARINALLSPTVSKQEKRPVKFSITELSLKNTSLDILDYTLPVFETGFDYGKLRFRNLVARGEDFFAKSDTIAVSVESLRGVESTSGLEVQQLQTDFLYSNTGMVFDNLYLRSNETIVRNYLEFSYDEVRDLSDFNNSVNIRAQLSEAVLDIKDLKYFAEQIPDFDDKIYLSGEITGQISDLASEQLLIRFGERSAMFGKFDIEGLPNVEETFFRLSLMNSTLTSADLAPYLSDEARRQVNKFRDIRFDGDFTGYFENFTASGNFRTGIGNMNGRLNYRRARNVPTYSGSVELQNLNIGLILDQPELFQRVTMKGQLKGTGLTAESAILSLDADINSIGINKYNYANIRTNATYGKDLFSGKLNIRDPNLKMQLAGKMDLRSNKDSVRLEAKIDTAFLQNLNLIKEDIFISGNFNLDTKGVEIDDIEGAARFEDMLFSYEGRDLHVDQFIFQSLFTPEGRVIALNSDLLTAGISGNYKLEELGKDLTTLGQEYFALITSQPEKAPVITENDLMGSYNFDININLIDPNPLIYLLDPSLSISDNTVIEGAFYQTPENTILNLFSDIDTVYYKGHYFLDNNLDFNTSKLRGDSDVLASFYINSKQQQLSSGITFNDFSLEALWDQAAIDLNINFAQEETDSYARIRSHIEVGPDEIDMVFEPSELKVLDRFWEIEPDNQLVYTLGNLEIINLKLVENGQFLALNGKISKEPEDVLSLEMHQVDMSLLNTWDIKEFEGTANGLFAISNILENPVVMGNLNVDEFHINNFLIGNLDATTYFDNDNDRIHLDLTNTRLGKKIIAIEGYLGTKEDQLDLVAKFEEANLSIAEPFLSDYITNLGGTLTGELDIRGRMYNPEITGSGRLTAGNLRVNYLNTTYTVDGRVNFTPNEISFRGLELTDTRGNKANMRGGISHDRFSNFILDISSDLNNFQVLNTTIRDNDLFYGTAYASGKLEIFGAANNLDINAQATSQPNTRIYIPIGSSDGQFKEDFINIINVRDTTRQVATLDQVEKLALQNVRMNFNLDITPDAYAEIIIDPRTGESIQGRGRGNLNLGIDTQGNFTMSGIYEIVDARYNFSLYNIINKEFTIEPGGRISWFGDPYEGILNIKAIYEENVSLMSLQPAQTTASTDMMDSQLRRRFPVKVIMGLQGPLLSPDINFDFDFSGFPEGEIQTYISAFRNRISNDEQEKNRQVFSLIMLRRFSPEGQFSGAGIGFSNLSQLVSSQLNALVAQVDQNLEIDFDLATLDQTALESFQLRVAYTFLDGRLRVMRDGGFTDLQGNTDLNTIAGDWQAEYLLTEDGRYRLRVYNRNNFNNAFTSLNLSANVITYGVSISQTLSFSSFQELIENIGKNRRQRLLINDIDDFLRYDFEEGLLVPNEEVEPVPIRVIEGLLDLKSEEEEETPIRNEEEN